MVRKNVTPDVATLAAEIGEVLAGVADPGQAADQLIDLALRAGGPDNVTAVVFDVVGAINPEDAARIVRDALRMHDGSHFRAALTEVNSDDRLVEAWWFPEPGDKHIDGNDRPPATLTWLDGQ